MDVAGNGCAGVAPGANDENVERGRKWRCGGGHGGVDSWSNRSG